MSCDLFGAVLLIAFFHCDNTLYIDSVTAFAIYLKKSTIFLIFLLF